MTQSPAVYSMPWQQEQEERQEAALMQSMGFFVDPAWYRQRYPEIMVAKIDPVRHFIQYGLAERRDPNRFFDSEWYLEHYPDVSASGLHPLLHYLQTGAAELRNPHPRFDAVFYAGQHPEAAANPLLYHIKIGLTRSYPTEKPLVIRDYLPSTEPALALPPAVRVDVVIPVYKGLEETRRCILSVLADCHAPLERVIVVDDRSPDPKLAAWLKTLAAAGKIVLLRNRRNLGFVASVNRGMDAAGDHDVVLLNSDTEVPAGWLGRLAAQAYAQPNIATVSPFSNNATICGYPGNTGGPIAFDQTMVAVDTVCQEVNAGRWVDVPTTVGFCMYIRRAALQDVGGFDAERFTVGYGEENDFCLRASAQGWSHRLACDIFVYHEGSVSFGAAADELTARAMDLLQERYPHYAGDVARHVSLGAVVPFRFAVTAALLRRCRLPVILMVSHDFGGGVQRHIDMLVERSRDKAHVLLLQATARGTALSVPALPDHPVLAVPGERIEDLTRLLRSMAVSRVHIHHLVGMDMDIRSLVHRLGLPFDVTVHDYHAICPQMNLLPYPDGLYCGEPNIAACNACIAARPAHGAHDIQTWRMEQAWPFLEANRVLCPSEDVLKRISHYGLGDKAILVPHESVAAEPWTVHVPPVRTGKLRIAVLGVLADHKGARSVAAVAEAADPKSIELHLIGHPEANFPQPALKRLRVTGQYEEADLAELIRKVSPHVIWFPAVWPETFSYTLSTAIASGLPIVATHIGAFPERLAGRPFTWLAERNASPAAWLALFQTIRSALMGAPNAAASKPRVAVEDFYASPYLRPVRSAAETAPVPMPIRMRGTRDRPIVAVVPERYDNGVPTPCGYIRLLQPLRHPATSGGARVLLADMKSVLDYDVDVIVTQRYAPPSLDAADALIAHARRTGARLVYDLDDDLLKIPPSHPDAAVLRPRAPIVRRMLERANAVWVSTQSLKDRLSSIRPDAVVLENRLDERLWTAPAGPAAFRDDPVRILCMGTSTHDRDFAMIEPALVRLTAAYGARVGIDILGMTNQGELSKGLNRVGLPARSGRSYPGFVNGLTSVEPRWHIGLAPLLDTPFNACKSPIKTMDYAALGLAVLASDVPVYRGSLADGCAGQLVANDPGAWYAALDWLVRDQDLRRSLAERAYAAFLERASLASHADARRDAWAGVFAGAKTAPALRRGASALTIVHDPSDPITRTRRHSG
jgi:GT2 family glycosyltransferase/glycosyltransferase involved in cell wall biosynthesis